MRVFFLTTFALVAFAFNSILCRLALGTGLIDAGSFTVFRLVSGAATLFVILSLTARKPVAAVGSGNWLSAFFLFAYAISFSFAYNGLTTATGALILFGAVQATMILTAIIGGERPGLPEWLGLLLALAGLVYLVFPGLESPPVIYSLLMGVAGTAWGFYTLRGKGSRNPLAETTGNFTRSLPFLLPMLVLPFFYRTEITASGLFLAVLSGAVASGIGYAVWYSALRYHTATRAAIVQLSVPAIAAAGGLLLIGEVITLRLILASTLILGGIALAVLGRRGKKDSSSNSGSRCLHVKKEKL